MEYLGDYGELCTFDNIRCTPAWYYKEFPGFYNVECYRILANWKEGVRSETDDTPEQDTRTYQLTQQSDGAWVTQHTENKKRKLETEEPDIECETDSVKSEVECIEHNVFFSEL